MARKRMIDPKIWESEDFSTLSNLAKVLFIGLFSLADDEGRGKANPIYIRSKLFPYTVDKVRPTDITTALSEIAQSMSITFYTVNGTQYYALTHWDFWQKIDKPSPSTFPSPEEADGLVEYSTNDQRTLDEDYALIEKNKNRTEENKNKKENTNRLRARFAEFWMVYPKKMAKQEAEKAWEKNVTSDEVADLIISDVKQRVYRSDWARENGRFIPYPATYLNQHRWEDEEPRKVVGGLEREILRELGEEL